MKVTYVMMLLLLAFAGAGAKGFEKLDDDQWDAEFMYLETGESTDLRAFQGEYIHIHFWDFRHKEDIAMLDAIYCSLVRDDFFILPVIRTVDVKRVKAFVDSTPNSRDILYYLIMSGLIETKKKNYAEAIELFSQAYELLDGQNDWIESHAWILFRLAKAYELGGDIEAAKKEYENILLLTTGRFWWGDLYVKSYYELGKIHEEQGNRSKAVEHYEKFISLWKDADPGLPEVDDAKKRLAGLKNK